MERPNGVARWWPQAKRVDRSKPPGAVEETGPAGGPISAAATTDRFQRRRARRPLQQGGFHLSYSSPIVDQYLSDSADFESLSKEQWPEEMAVYRDYAQNMKRAVDGGRLADFQHEVRDIRTAMTACHRALKKYHYLSLDMNPNER